jgi:peptidoglycan/xylan/chitin deacetylase (PgdA/CDA1 family)
MSELPRALSRRQVLQGAIAAASAFEVPRAAPGFAAVPAPGDLDSKALVAITLDLEMSRHYPTWDDMHWDFEKGNLDDTTKRYASAAARRVKEHGGVVHFFAVGRVLEQENVDWLRQIHDAGHPVGNHTYDHVNVKATKSSQIQFRF